MVAVIFVIEWAAGWVSVVGFETSISGFVGALSFLTAGLFTFVAVGFREELVFRGYLFQNLGERLPIWAPTLLLGLVFALIHYGNEGFTLAFVIGAAMITVFFVLTRLLTGALWFGIGWHAGYDFMLVAVFNSSSAADRDDYGHSLVHVEQSGPELLVGVSSYPGRSRHDRRSRPGHCCSGGPLYPPTWRLGLVGTAQRGWFAHQRRSSG